MGPVLFNVFINNLKLEVDSVVAKFVDNTKLFSMVKTKAGFSKFQEDLHKLAKFIVGKCKLVSDACWDKESQL